MAKNSCSLVINGHSVQANIGDTLVDAGLGGWKVIPHDCCSGQCETCRVTVVSGSVNDQGTADGNTVLACQATLQGNVEIQFDEVPPIAKSAGILTEVTPLSPDVIEVVVTLSEAIEYFPGQYLNVKFSGFPGRDLSPSMRLDGTQNPKELVFQIRRYPGGLVSTQIGATIRPGHRVQIRGPFGQAFLREGTGRLVLVSGGTGWAPIWSIANAAKHSQPEREQVVIAGVREPADLYMRPALEWLRDSGVSNVVAVVETDAPHSMVNGLPTQHLPALNEGDTVYVAGPLGLVDAVKATARSAGVRCYADPFLPGVQKLSLVDRIMQMVRGQAEPAPAVVPAPYPQAGRRLEPAAQNRSTAVPAPAQAPAQRRFRA